MTVVLMMVYFIKLEVQYYKCHCNYNSYVSIIECIKI